MSSTSTSIVVAPHLWRALEIMGRDMGVEPGALVNQAVFAWLRINGYVVPGTAGQAAASLAPVPVPVAPAAPVAAPVAAAAPETAAPPPAEDPVGAVAARIGEIESDLARFTKPRPAFPSAEEPVQEEEQEEEEQEEKEEPVDAPVSGESTVPSVALRAEEEPEHTGEGTVVLKSAPVVLYIERNGEAAIRVERDRFVIGRGPQCDLVIDSPRVSREHAVLSRLGVRFFIEDLGSSNGTWFGEEQVTKRELESGDVIRLGNEELTFSVRAE